MKIINRSIFCIVALLVSFNLVGCYSYEKVPAGHVGVEVNLYGSDKGVSEVYRGPGKYWISNINEELYIFPTYLQTKVWEGQQRIEFQTKEGMDVSANVGISYVIPAANVPKVFQTYKRGVDEITDVFLRSIVKNALVKEVSKRSVEEVYGEGKLAIMNAVKEAVTAEVATKGIVVDALYWGGSINLPQQVTKTLNAKIEATQLTLQRENEVKTAEAEAAKAIATAKGEAESALLRARAEAESIRIKADALSQNAKLVQLNAVDKWDGKLPVNMYASTPLPFIDVK